MRILLTLDHKCNHVDFGKTNHITTPGQFHFVTPVNNCTHALPLLLFRANLSWPFEVTTWTNGSIKGPKGGMGWKLIWVLVGCSLESLGFCGSASWTHSYSRQPLYGCLCYLPPHLPHPLPTNNVPFIMLGNIKKMMMYILVISHYKDDIIVIMQDREDLRLSVITTSWYSNIKKPGAANIIP